MTASVAVAGASKKIKIINSFKFVSKVQLTEKLSPVIMTRIPTKQLVDNAALTVIAFLLGV